MNKKLLLKNITLIKGNGEKPLYGAEMLIEEDTIKKIEAAGEIKSDVKTEILDLNGKTVMPGLIDCHVHVMCEPVADTFKYAVSTSDTEIALRGVNNFKKMLKTGVTYFRDLGGRNYIEIELKKCLALGLIEGPDFLACGKMITMTGGHGWLVGRECDGVSQARQAAREQLKAGADVIKVMATGGVTTRGVEPGSPQLTLEEIAAVCEEAHKAGRKVAAHAQGNEGIKNALRAGVDSIEHGFFLDDEAIEMMLKQRVFLVPTISAKRGILDHGIELGIPAFMVEKEKKCEESAYESFNMAREAGVKIAMGTDAGTPFNRFDAIPNEVLFMIKAGMTPMEAIMAATANAAELLGIDSRYGTLEEGKSADFIILREDPLVNPRVIIEPKEVYKAGKRVHF